MMKSKNNFLTKKLLNLKCLKQNEEYAIHCEVFYHVAAGFGFLSFVVSFSSACVYLVFQWKMRGLYDILRRFGNRELRMSETSETEGDRPRVTVKDAADRTSKRKVADMPESDIPTGMENQNASTSGASAPPPEEKL